MATDGRHTVQGEIAQAFAAHKGHLANGAAGDRERGQSIGVVRVVESTAAHLAILQGDAVGHRIGVGKSTGTDGAVPCHQVGGHIAPFETALGDGDPIQGHGGLFAVDPGDIIESRGIVDVSLVFLFVHLQLPAGNGHAAELSIRERAAADGAASGNGEVQSGCVQVLESPRRNIAAVLNVQGGELSCILDAAFLQRTIPERDSSEFGA